MEEFEKYFKGVKKEHKRGQYTEHTFRSYLKKLIEDLFPMLKLSEESKGSKGVGRPDYTCFKNIVKIGYIEAKDLGKISSEVGLRTVLSSKQIYRYSTEAIPNMIITDYLRFVLYRNQKVRLDVTLFSEKDLTKGMVVFDEKNINKFKQLIESFLDYSLPTITNATELAIELSKRAKLLRELSEEQLEKDLKKAKNNEPTSSIYDFYGVFRELIKDAKPSDCVDAYAQTITYGLFLSKIGAGDGLSRDTAVRFIPSSIKIIKKIFMNITGDELPENLSWIVDEIVDILNASDIKKILSKFVFKGKTYRDPFIHFYEDFLKEYDPTKRKKLGVYYTPEPVVSFITRSINEILKKEFGKTSGFANDSVTVLDPATGTGTFLANTFVIALQEIREKGLTGIEREKIKNHLLKHFYAFEILVSPYVISHLKLSVLLKKEGYKLDDKDRIQIYLTNTLDPSEITHHLGVFLKELSQENIIANKIKKDKKVLVVMGNPPYSVSSSNKSKWIMNLMKDYKKNLEGERNIQPLNDDYIKFIRFAQWKINQNGTGVLGFISNSRFLDGRIHRQMRKSLLESFDNLYILNLHGSSRRKTTEMKDENVFDIQQGVAISLFVKNNKNKKTNYFEIRGSRKDKYSFLYNNSIETLKWKEINPKGTFYFFTKRETRGELKYEKFTSLNEIFVKFTSGVKTHRDKFIVGYDTQEVKERLVVLKKDSLTRDLIKKLNCSDKEKEKFLNHLKKGIVPDNFKTYDYRIFDKRFVYYDDVLVTRHRKNVMKNFINTNIGLVSTKLLSGEDYKHVFCTSEIADICLLSTKTSESAYVFPLYLHRDDPKISSKDDYKQISLFGETVDTKKKYQENFTEEFKRHIKTKYGKQDLSPEQIFAYVYSILHSPNYRKKYREFLKIDFPRIPFVDDYKTFKKLSKLGEELIELHLMRKSFAKNIAKFEISGSNRVDFVKYKESEVLINNKQYFDRVPEEIWDFYIGGYRVLDKWLKSRKGRKLSHKEIETFVKIVNILSETIKIMSKIDSIKLD